MKATFHFLIGLAVCTLFLLACTGWNVGVCAGPNFQRWNASVCVSRDVAMLTDHEGNPTYHEPVDSGYPPRFGGHDGGSTK